MRILGSISSDPAAWDVQNDPFAPYSWIYQLRAAKQAGLSVHEKEIDKFLQQIYSDIGTRVENEQRRSRYSDVSQTGTAEKGRKSIQNGINSGIFSEQDLMKILSQWLLIRKWQSFLIEQQSKVSIQEVLTEYQSQNKVFQLQFVERSTDEIRRELESEGGLPAHEKAVLDWYYENHLHDHPEFRSPERIHGVLLHGPDISNTNALAIAEKDVTARLENELKKDSKVTREMVRSLLRTEARNESTRKSVEKATSLFESGTTNPATLALQTGLELTRIHDLTPEEIPETIFIDHFVPTPVVDALPNMQVGEGRVLRDESNEAPVFFILLSKSAEQVRTRSDIDRDTILEGYRASHPDKFTRDDLLTLQVAHANPTEASKSLQVTTRELRGFYDRIKSTLPPDSSGNPPSFEEVRADLELIQKSTLARKQCTERIEELSTLLEDSKKSFEAESKNLELHYQTVGPISMSNLSAFPFFRHEKALLTRIQSLQPGQSGATLTTSHGPLYVRVTKRDTTQEVSPEAILDVLYQSYCADRTKKDMTQIAETMRKTSWKEGANQNRLTIQDTGTFQDARKLTQFGQNVSAILSSIRAENLGKILDPIQTDDESRTFLIQVTKATPPSENDIPDHAVERIRSDISKRRLADYQSRYLESRSVLETAIKNGELSLSKEVYKDLFEK
jgi:hypothetical protein